MIYLKSYSARSEIHRHGSISGTIAWFVSCDSRIIKCIILINTYRCMCIGGHFINVWVYPRFHVCSWVQKLVSFGGIWVKIYRFEDTSTLFPKLIGITIGEIGWVVSEEKRTRTTTRQTSKFTKSKYIVTLTCSHGGAKVKIKYMLQIHIVPSVDWHQHWRIWSSSFGGEANTNYYRQSP